MAIEGELKGTAGARCICKRNLELSVCQSGAGYYLGYFCNRCGPYSRESGYFETHVEATCALAGLRDTKLRNTNYNG